MAWGGSSTHARARHLQQRRVRPLQELHELGDDARLDDLLDGRVALCGVAAGPEEKPGFTGSPLFPPRRLSSSLLLPFCANKQHSDDGSPMDSSFLKRCVASYCSLTLPWKTPFTIMGSSSSCCCAPERGTHTEEEERTTCCPLRKKCRHHYLEISPPPLNSALNSARTALAQRLRRPCALRHALLTLPAAAPLVLSSMPPKGSAGVKVERFFCRFSSRLFWRSAMMLSSRLRRASSASTPFL